MQAFADALAQAGVTDGALSPLDRRALAEDGYVVLRGAIGANDAEALRACFEANILAPDKWPAPREDHLRHAWLNDDAAVRRTCLLPRMLAVVAACITERFCFYDVQGRDPKRKGGYQELHRDWPDEGAETKMVVALAFLDDYSPSNGATRVVARTHKEAGGMSDYARFGESHPDQTVVEGLAGDVLMFPGRLVHSGMRNQSGAPRRTLQISYRAMSALDPTRDERLGPRNFDGASPLERYLMGAD